MSLSGEDPGFVVSKAYAVSKGSLEEKENKFINLKVDMKLNIYEIMRKNLIMARYKL